MATLAIGDEAVIRLVVAPEHTAARFGLEPGESYPEVMATAVMVREMERAAAKLLRPLLAPGELSVGVRVEVTHAAPTPVGAAVVTRARYLGLDGKLHAFEVWAEDPGGEIGRGRHLRAIVAEARLLAGAAKRRGG